MYLFTRGFVVAQQQRTHLPMQETRIPSQGREDLTRYRATKPTHQNYCAQELQLPEPALCDKRSHHNEKPSSCKKSNPCFPQVEEIPSSSGEQAQPKINK